MSNKILISVTIAFVSAALITANIIFAANLSQAVSTLPANEEWSIMARAAIGQNSGLDYLRQPLNSNVATDYEKRILAITAIGQNPRTIGTENFVAKLESMFDGNQIGETFLLNDDIFGILALKSAGVSGNIIDRSRQYILSNQNSNGGWGYAPGVGSDSNTTAMAIAALSITGGAPGNAYSYIDSTKVIGSGYSYQPAQTADGASTAWVIAGLSTAGRSVSSEATSFLESLQLSNGAFKWMPTDSSGSSLVTAYAVIALSGRGIPVGTISPNPTPPPAPNPPPAPLPQPPAPNPAPPPGPNPVPPPPPAPQPTPPPAPTPVPLPPPPSGDSVHVSITYPGNKIYVGNVTFNPSNFVSKTGQNFSSSSPTALQALVTAMDEINLLYEIQQLSFGPFVKTINGYHPSGLNGWLYAVNGNIPQVGANDYMVRPGDRIQWFYGGPTTTPYQ